MQPKAPSSRVVPANALFHVALTQRQYAAVLAATQFFAKKLQNPRERQLAEEALQALQNITGMSLPSEHAATGADEPPVISSVSHVVDQGVKNLKTDANAVAGARKGLGDFGKLAGKRKPPL